MARRRAHQIPGGNNHHLFFPRSEYKTKLERQFRNLPCMQVYMDYYAHHLLHEMLKIFPLPKPSNADMLRAVNRHHEQRCSCYQ